MKRSLIITAVLCLALGESFSIISKKEKAQQMEAPYCCMNSSSKPLEKAGKANAVAGPYLPIVNILGYN